MDLHVNGNLKDVVRTCAQGDKDAFRELYDTLSGPLFGYLTARTDTREDAKDVLQDVFVDLWRALPGFRYRSDRQFYGFVYTITKRKLVRYYRELRRTVELDEARAEERREPRDRDVTLLSSAIASLGRKYREVLELRHWSDLPFADIAKLLKTKETTVKVRHHRAIKHLSRLMQDGYGE